MLSGFGDVLTVTELSQVMQICPTTAYKLLRSKEIKSIKLGNQFRIPKKWLIEYIEEKVYIQ